MSKKIHFEQAILELEQIVQLLDSPEISLEKAIKAYEQGQKLIQLCQEQLLSAQTRLQQLTPASVSAKIEIEGTESIF